MNSAELIAWMTANGYFKQFVTFEERDKDTVTKLQLLNRTELIDIIFSLCDTIDELKEVRDE